MLGSPASSNSVLSRRYAVPGFIGSSGLVGCGKIHWLMEAFFRARSSAATLSARIIVRLPWLVFVSPRA